jgi:hypothetical protein
MKGIVGGDPVYFKKQEMHADIDRVDGKEAH